MAENDTFPKLLVRNARERGTRAASREKDLGIWQTWSWSEVEDQIRALALGLHEMGLKKDQKLAIIGDNGPHLYWAQVAAQVLGAVPVPVYQDAPANELQYVLDHAEVSFAIAEDQEQVDKLLDVMEACPKLTHLIYKDPRGLRHYDQPFLQRYTDVQEKGRAFHKANPDFFLNAVNATDGEDTALIPYTSGTTGKPKGVILTHNNLLKSAQAGAAFEGLTEKEEILAYLPMAWIGDNIFSMAQSYSVGFCVSCPESQATVLHDLREIGPTYFFAPPRIFENILTTVMIRMDDASWIKRTMFHYFMGVAKKVGIPLLDGDSVGIFDRLKYWLGELLIYGPLKNTLGFSRIRICYTAGEAIGPDIFDFFRALGINMKQLYGSTESSVFITIQPNGEIKPDTVGIAIPGVEIKITDEGEVMFRSPGVFKEYYKNPDATKETKTADGWVHTGDAGVIGPDNHLKIIDRAKDVGKLDNGQMFAPKFIENKLKFFPFIKEAVAFGHQRDTATAMISIDLEAVGNWAERNNEAYASYQELAAKEKVYDMIQENVESVNRDLAEDPNLNGSQITRFVLLHKELDADDGELTRTRKVRRSTVHEKYKNVIDALYGGEDSVFCEVDMKFEDGRSGTVKGDLRIRDARTFESTGQQMAAE